MSHKRCEGQHGECPECGNDLDPDVICKKCKEHTEYCPECGTACCSAGKVDYGDYNDRDESKVDKLLGLCTEMARHDYTGIGDVKGSNVSDKDVMRLEDIKDKANGDEGKVLSLATRMAQLIKDPDKAMRRAKAAKLVFAGELGKKVYDIFVKAA